MNACTIEQIEKDIKFHRNMAKDFKKFAKESTRIADCLEELIVYRRALQVANKESVNEQRVD